MYKKILIYTILISFFLVGMVTIPSIIIFGATEPSVVYSLCGLSAVISFIIGYIEYRIIEKNKI